MARGTIYLYCVPCGVMGFDDVVGYALAEDGTGLASHLSSNEAWSKHDMGFSTDRKHDVYAEHYPDGYELVWLDAGELETHAGFLEAWQKNVARAAAGSSTEKATP